ncbi:MAG: argininosuccinate lyase [Stenotrophobium sp.]
MTEVSSVEMENEKSKMKNNDKLWAGRFREPLNAEFERWQRSFPFDRRLLQDEIAASAAYARALARTGIFTDQELHAVLNGLQAIASKAHDPAFLENDEVEDVHDFVERQLVAHVGDTGYKLHAGRSRNEQIATDLRLFARRSIDEIRRALGGVCDVLLSLARKHQADPMPSYTHLQRAEPVTIAHWLLAYVEMFLRDADRLADARRRVNVLPLGSGAVAGPGIVIDRASIAKELGFETISGNSMDATSDRDFELEVVQVLAQIALHVSRMAEEFALFSTVEYGFVQLPEAFSTGSSAMPQKKNPDALELLRGKAARVVGAATALATLGKGLPLAYNKDFQEAQEPLFDAADTIAGSLAVLGGFLRAVGFNTERMRTAAASGHLNATAAARYLVSKGVPFRMAHAAVGQCVRLALDKGCELQALSIEELRGIRAEFAEDFYPALELDAVLASHNVPGATAPSRVSEAISAAAARVAVLQK